MPATVPGGVGGDKSFQVAAKLATADTSRTAPTTLVTLKVADTYGSVVNQIDLLATATTTAGVIRLWLYDGTTYYLIAEIIVDAVTPSVSLAVWSTTWTPPITGSVFGQQASLLIPPGWTLKATTNNSEGFNVVTSGRDN